MSKRTTALATIVVIAVAGGTAWAADTVRSLIGRTGLSAAATCSAAAVFAWWNPAPRAAGASWRSRGTRRASRAIPDRGPKGDKGDAGPAGAPGGWRIPGGPSCSTRGSAGDGPNGHLKVTALATHLQLNCVSDTPILTIQLRAKATKCFTDPPGCIYSWGTVTEVDENGATVTGGFGCTATNGWTGSASCTNGYVHLGTTIHLRADPPAGLTATWSGCDSVNAAGDVCTRTITIGPQTVSMSVS